MIGKYDDILLIYWHKEIIIDILLIYWHKENMMIYYNIWHKKYY